MAEPLTLSTAPLEHVGMDYAFLRQEGIQLIEKLAGDRWSDYNTSDPGITILEAWCYALTDLSYRLSFAMEDLLAFPSEEKDRPALFLSAREALTTVPLTVGDYRKLLIDIVGVKNAWLEPIEQPEPPLYYDAKNAKLSFSNLDSLNLTEPIHLRGLYRVLIETEADLAPNAAEQLIRTVTTKLNQHRNLCEDFAEVRILPPETITVRTELEIAEHIDPSQLMAKLYAALAHIISPSLDFLTLSELLDQGTPVEEIFAGPALDHGFIDDAQLQQFDRQQELRTSDLIHVILEMSTVKTVRHITLSSSESATPEPWALDLNPQLTPRLKSLRQFMGDVTLYKGKISCPIDVAKAEQALSDFYQAKRSHTTHSTKIDLPIPQGDYRELAEYESLQSEFPMVYGIGEAGLPGSASPLRKAQAKQLQSYLMVFDQLLANYFSQLDSVRELFLPGSSQLQSYFTQSIAHFPGAKEILFNSKRHAEEGRSEDNWSEDSQREGYLKALQEEQESAIARKNRFLEHLIAQYGESFLDYSLLQTDNRSDSQSAAAAAIQHKADFAADYRQVSAGRAQAFNYQRPPTHQDNVSGLKRRVARLLGIEPVRRSLTAAGTGDRNIEGFYVIEHILLRPHQASSTTTQGQTADFLTFSQKITAYSPASTSGRLTCTSTQHGLKAGETINLIYSSRYNGTYTALNVQENTFEIEANFVANHSIEQDAWARQSQHPDPFSFQISIVLPDWPQRFSTHNFHQLIYDTLQAETPAHITLSLHWLTADAMRTFEVMHDLWLQDLSGTATDNSASQSAAQAAANQLIDFLCLGSTAVPEIPSLVGYMAIDDPNEDIPGPHFVVN